MLVGVRFNPKDAREYTYTFEEGEAEIGEFLLVETVYGIKVAQVVNLNPNPPKSIRLKPIIGKPVFLPSYIESFKEKWNA